MAATGGLTAKHFDTRPAFPYKKASRKRLANLAAWLAHRNHNLATLRRAVPKYRSARGLLDRVVNLFVPWNVWEYPGWWRWAGGILGTKASTAAHYAKSGKRLPGKHARTLEALCRSRAAALISLADDLRAHAEQMEATVEPGSVRLKRFAADRTAGLRDRRNRPINPET